MDLSRRMFCGAGAAMISSQFILGTTSAQSEITVTGNLTTQADTDVNGLEFELYNRDNDDVARVTLDSTGNITTTVSDTGTFAVTIFDYSSDLNGLPAVYSFQSVDIGEDGDIGEFSLPEAYITDIRCLDTEGSPVENLPVNFRAPNGAGMSPGTFTTTADGYVKYYNASDYGIELADKADIEIQLPSDPNTSEYIRMITVSESDEIELTITNPDQYTSNVEKITENPDGGFHFPYYLYTPAADQVTNSGNGTLDNINPRPLIVGFRTWGSRSEREERIADARDDLLRDSKIRTIADELHTPAMIIPLPSSTNDGKFELLNRDSLRISEPPYERLDLQIFSMVNDAKQRLADQPYDIADKVHLDGFSNNDRLCDQLSILHPERITAVTGGGDGFHTIPKSKYEGEIPVQNEPETTTLEWPVGTAGLDDLIGKEFNKEAWLNTAVYYYIGAEDQGNNDESNLRNEYIHAKSYSSFGKKRQQLLVDIFGWDQVDERFETSRQIFETVGADARFKIYSGVGHSISDEMEADIIQFHRQQMISDPSVDNAQSSATRVGNDSESAETSASENNEQSSNTTENTNSTSSKESSAETPGSTNKTQPGFGLIQTIATLAGLGYLIRGLTRSKSE